MTEQTQTVSKLSRLTMAALLTLAFASAVAWSWQSFGRTWEIAFAFGVNWILMGWAVSVARILESRSGAWDGLSIRLPESYYAMRPFEEGGRVYDHLGVRWYQRSRLWNWSVKPSRLRSDQGARQAMTRATRDPEAGHLVIFAVIMGITLWALACGWWSTVAWLLLFNILHNGYPVLSMRQIRARLHRSDSPRRPEKRTQQQEWSR